MITSRGLFSSSRLVATAPSGCDGTSLADLYTDPVDGEIATEAFRLGELVKRTKAPAAKCQCRSNEPPATSGAGPAGTSHPEAVSSWARPPTTYRFRSPPATAPPWARSDDARAVLAMGRDDQHPPDPRQWLTFTPLGAMVHLEYGKP